MSNIAIRAVSPDDPEPDYDAMPKEELDRRLAQFVDLTIWSTLETAKIVSAKVKRGYEMSSFLNALKVYYLMVADGRMADVIEMGNEEISRVFDRGKIRSIQEQSLMLDRQRSQCKNRPEEFEGANLDWQTGTIRLPSRAQSFEQMERYLAVIRKHRQRKKGRHDL